MRGSATELITYPELGYQLTSTELAKRLAKYNPIDLLEPLASYQVKLFRVRGDNDHTVPLDANIGRAVAEMRGTGRGSPGRGGGGRQTCARPTVSRIEKKDRLSTRRPVARIFRSLLLDSKTIIEVGDLVAVAVEDDTLGSMLPGL